MLKVDSTLNHVPARREHVISLHESINQPLVNIPVCGTASTGAFILGTRNDQGRFTVFVYLYQPETRAVVVYVSEPRVLGREQFRAEEAEAVRFVESMGFLVDDVHFPTLPPPEQAAVMARIPMFRPPSEETWGIYGNPSSDTLDALPEASPMDVEAIFGGLTDADSEVFLEAGLGAAPAPSGLPKSGLSHSGLSHSGLPHSGLPKSGERRPISPPPPPPLPPLDTGPLPTFEAFLGARSVSARPGPASSRLPAPVAPPPGDDFLAALDAGLASGVSGWGDASPAATGGLPPESQRPSAASDLGPAWMDSGLPRPEDAPSKRPTNGGVSPEPDRAKVLERLGKLLGTFALLAAFAALPSACRSGGAASSERGERSVDSHVDLANQQLAEGRWADAIRTFDLVLEEEETNKDALRGEALAYMNLGRMEQAEVYYRQAIASDPKWSIPKNELAVVLISKERCVEAEALLREVLEDIFYSTPEYAEHNLARALECQGRVNDAVELLDKLVLKRPGFCLGYLTLAQLSSQIRRHELTIRVCDDFTHNCEQHPERSKQVLPEHSAVCYLRKGLAYAEIGDLESARASFERCQPAGPIGRECRRSLEMLPP